MRFLHAIMIGCFITTAFSAARDTPEQVLARVTTRIDAYRKTEAEKDTAFRKDFPGLSKQLDSCPSACAEPNWTDEAVMHPQWTTYKKIRATIEGGLEHLKTLAHTISEKGDAKPLWEATFKTTLETSAEDFKEFMRFAKKTTAAQRDTIFAPLQKTEIDAFEWRSAQGICLKYAPASTGEPLTLITPFGSQSLLEGGLGFEPFLLLYLSHHFPNLKKMEKVELHTLKLLAAPERSSPPKALSEEEIGRLNLGIAAQKAVRQATPKPKKTPAAAPKPTAEKAPVDLAQLPNYEFWQLTDTVSPIWLSIEANRAQQTTHLASIGAMIEKFEKGVSK